MNAPLIDHEKFIEQRYDILIRFYFLELAGFDVEKAKEIYESEEYGFLEPVLERLKIFDSNKKKTWKYIDAQVSKDVEWMKRFPYLVTMGGCGLSVKRFLLSTRYWGVKLYWMQIDHHMDMDKVGFYKWNRDTYKDVLTRQQFNLFRDKERTLLMVMREGDYFSEKTKVGHLKNGTIVLY